MGLPYFSPKLLNIFVEIKNTPHFPLSPFFVLAESTSTSSSFSILCVFIFLRKYIESVIFC